jgi:lipopolysaccharide/colanic/teichoic acid biosynthesis glycosyltransferase
LRFTGEGEVFYLQERIGKGRKPFAVKKFATMLKNSANIGTGTITIKNDPRVLPIGKILRKTKINELPQLLNILNGDMSVIGPRPLTRQTFDAYSKEVQECIVQVRPGLSGAGSIVFRDEEKLLQNVEESTLFYNEVIAPYKGQLEQWYTENNSLRTYFVLIFLTVYAVLSPSSQVFWKVFKSAPKPTGELYGRL